MSLEAAALVWLKTGSILTCASTALSDVSGCPPSDGAFRDMWKMPKTAASASVACFAVGSSVTSASISRDGTLTHSVSSFLDPCCCQIGETVTKEEESLVLENSECGKGGNVFATSARPLVVSPRRRAASSPGRLHYSPWRRRSGSEGSGGPHMSAMFWTSSARLRLLSEPRGAPLDVAAATLALA